MLISPIMPSHTPVRNILGHQHPPPLWPQFPWRLVATLGSSSSRFRSPTPPSAVDPADYLPTPRVYCDRLSKRRRSLVRYCVMARDSDAMTRGLHVMGLDVFTRLRRPFGQDKRCRRQEAARVRLSIPDYIGPSLDQWHM